MADHELDATLEELWAEIDRLSERPGPLPTDITTEMWMTRNNVARRTAVDQMNEFAKKNDGWERVKVWSNETQRYTRVLRRVNGAGDGQSTSQ